MLQKSVETSRERCGVGTVRLSDYIACANRNLRIEFIDHVLLPQVVFRACQRFRRMKRMKRLPESGVCAMASCAIEQEGHA